jgi:hypothetical protein
MTVSLRADPAVRGRLPPAPLLRLFVVLLLLLLLLLLIAAVTVVA